MTMSVNIVVAGVGGQGSVLASRIIADAVLAGSDGNGREMNVRVGETFGAAMRGGAVSSHVRIGRVLSPLVGERAADLVLALEPLEGLRVSVKFLRPGGNVVLNTVPLLPTDVKTGMAAYPELSQVTARLEALGARVLAMDANRLAEEAGNGRTMNVVILGAALATGVLPFAKDSMLAAIRGRVPSRFLDVNLSAFEVGVREGERLLGR